LENAWEFWALVCLPHTVTATAEEEAGVIYTMDNAAADNHVLAWKRMANGTLSGPAMHATGGAGTGAGLSSQGSVLLSHDGRWLFVCNAGSDEISVFEVGPQGLQLVDKVSSGGRLGGPLAGGAGGVAWWSYGDRMPMTEFAVQSDNPVLLFSYVAIR
jgi:hypothetical protein